MPLVLFSLGFHTHSELWHKVKVNLDLKCVRYWHSDSLFNILDISWTKFFSWQIWGVASDLLIFKKSSEFHYKCLPIWYWKLILFKTLNSCCNLCLTCFCPIFGLYSSSIWFTLLAFYLVHINTICGTIITLALCLAPLYIIPSTLPRCQTIFIHHRWKDNRWIKYSVW